MAAGLKDLHLVNTCFLHHPQMVLPEGLHLDCLTACTIGKSVNLLPVELLKRTKQVLFPPLASLSFHKPLPLRWPPAPPAIHMTAEAAGQSRAQWEIRHSASGSQYYGSVSSSANCWRMGGLHCQALLQSSHRFLESLPCNSQTLSLVQTLSILVTCRRLSGGRPFT